MTGISQNQSELPTHGINYINIFLAIIQTNMGDIHIRLFPQECPKTVENFVRHSKNGYYNNLIFHRVLYIFKF